MTTLLLKLLPFRRYVQLFVCIYTTYTIASPTFCQSFFIHFQFSEITVAFLEMMSKNEYENL